MKSWAKQTGFTIVELLIVIVVIGILAAITITAYNGVQTRARNTQTVQAVTAWVKAVKLYNVETGGWPSGTSCLGEIDTYQGDGGACWSNGAYVSNSAFINLIKPYMGNKAAIPSLNKVETTASGVWTRGGRYDNSGGTHSVYFVLQGVSICPDIAGLDNVYDAIYVSNGNAQCGGAII